MSSNDNDERLSRRSSASHRTLTPLRRLYFFLGMPVLRGILKLLVASYRNQPMIGTEHLQAFRDGASPVT